MRFKGRSAPPPANGWACTPPPICCWRKVRKVSDELLMMSCRMREAITLSLLPPSRLRFCCRAMTLLLSQAEQAHQHLDARRIIDAVARPPAVRWDLRDFRHQAVRPVGRRVLGIHARNRGVVRIPVLHACRDEAGALPVLVVRPGDHAVPATLVR